MNFHVYIDGSCKVSTGKGGYAYTIYDEYNEVWVRGSGTEKETTEEKIKVTAAVESLRMIEKNYPSIINPHLIIIYSNNCYLSNCFEGNFEGNEMLKSLYEIVKKTGAVFQKVSKKDLRIQQVNKEAKSAAKNLR